ncbi:MAG: DUF3048 domain-containing protein [Candidatus Nanopelagicaceae bacterium]
MRRLAFLVLIFAITGCSFSDLPFTGPEPERNVLTGLEGSNGQVVAVKFDDTRYAHPQKGLDAADVIFVTQVEAGLTRIMAIYSSQYPEEVGPVRSARISDIDILAQFGRVGFMYSGAQSKLRPLLSAANIVNLSAERNPPSIYVTDPNREPPYAMMVKIPALLEKAEGIDLVKPIGIKHGELAESAIPILSARVDWPNAKYEIFWNEDEKRFLLDFDGESNVDEKGNRLGSPMMVIQLIEIYPSEYGDKFGGVTPKNDVVGNGTGYLLRNGKITKVNWSRSTPESETLWTLEDGSNALFERGQIWFFLTDKEPKFTYPQADPA